MSGRMGWEVASSKARLPGRSRHPARGYSMCLFLAIPMGAGLSHALGAGSPACALASHHWEISFIFFFLFFFFPFAFNFRAASPHPWVQPQPAGMLTPVSRAALLLSALLLQGFLGVWGGIEGVREGRGGLMQDMGGPGLLLTPHLSPCPIQTAPHSCIYLPAPSP